MSPVNREYTLIEQLPIPIWQGTAARCDYVNAAWRAFSGQTPEQALGEGWQQALHPDDAGRWRETLGKHLAQREGFEQSYRLRRGDGSWCHMRVRAAPYQGEDGVFAGVIAAWLDIREGGAVDQVSADDFFEMSRDNVCVAGFDGYLKRVNASWTRTLGWTPEELMARPVMELVHPDDRAAVLAARLHLHHGNDMGPLVNRYRAKDGSYRWFEWRSVGRVERGLVYAVARDITERKDTEERLREADARSAALQRQLLFADRMASMGTLAAGVAHEINNPLAYITANITMMLENLQGETGDSPEGRMAALREMALDVRDGTERIRRIVDGLRTFSRPEEEQQDRVDVLPLLEKSIAMTFNEIRHRARLVRDFGPMPPVRGERTRLEQVFVNLLVNAAQAIPDGEADAEIRISTGTDEQGRAVIAVRDTGVGIPPAAIGRIFDPFFTTKSVGAGTGLGLYICHNILTAMGGEISVASEPGHGSTFRVTLRAAAALQPEPTAPQTPPATRRAMVLVVDDEIFIGQALRRILREHDVTAVTTAPEALALLEQGRRFDVIFSDIMMPEMSGMAFYQELSRRFPEAAADLVFMSGGTFTDGASAFLEHLPNDLLPKPFTTGQVREIVTRHVLRREAG